MAVEVVVATDGPTNYVEHEGTRYSLGILSPSHFVGSLCRNVREARECLDAFIEKGSGKLMVDPDRMMGVLSNQQSRSLYAACPFISGVEYGASMELKAFQQKLAHFESHFKNLTAKVSQTHSARRASSFETDYAKLAKMAEELAEAADCLSAEEEEGVPSFQAPESEETVQETAKKALDLLTDTRVRMASLHRSGRKVQANQVLYRVACTSGRVAAALASADQDRMAALLSEATELDQASKAL